LKFIFGSSLFFFFVLLLLIPCHPARLTLADLEAVLTFGLPGLSPAAAG
jgi:hypothetical protein